MKRILALALILLIALGLFGCAKAPEEIAFENITESSVPENKKVMLCISQVDHPLHRIVQYGFIMKAKELNMIPYISGLEGHAYPYTENIEQYKKDIEQIDPDGIVFFTGDDSCYDLMKELKKQGKFVITTFFSHNFDTTKEFIDVTIPLNDSAIASVAAEYIVDKLEKQGITEGSIGESSHFSNLYNDKETGLNTTLYNDILRNTITKFKVLPPVTEGVSEEQSVPEIVEYINNNPDMVAAIGTSTASAMYWNEAINATGRTDIEIICIDVTPLNIEYTGKTIDALISRPLYESGEQSIITLSELFNNKVFNNTPENWTVELHPKVVCYSDKNNNDFAKELELLNNAQEYFVEE